MNYFLGYGKMSEKEDLSKTSTEKFRWHSIPKIRILKVEQNTVGLDFKLKFKVSAPENDYEKLSFSRIKQKDVHRR